MMARQPVIASRDREIVNHVEALNGEPAQGEHDQKNDTEGGDDLRGNGASQGEHVRDFSITAGPSMLVTALTSVRSSGRRPGQKRKDGGRAGSIQARTECFAERDHAGAC